LRIPDRPVAYRAEFSQVWFVVTGLTQTYWTTEWTQLLESEALFAFQVVVAVY